MSVKIEDIKPGDRVRGPWYVVVSVDPDGVYVRTEPHGGEIYFFNNGGVVVMRVGASRGIAFVETRDEARHGLSAFDWSTVTADMRDRPVADDLSWRAAESRA